MAQVELPKGIVAIHGRLGDYIYRSRKQPDGSYKVFAHYSPKVKKLRIKNYLSLLDRCWTVVGPMQVR